MTTRVVAIAGKKNAQNVSAGTVTLRELQFFLSKTKKYTAAVYCAVIIRQCTSRSRVASTVYLTYTRGQSAHPKIPLEKFSPSGGVPSGILPSRGILKNIILCRHKTFNPPEGLIPCMPCRGKTYKIPLAFFSISTPAGFNLVENSGGKT